MKTIRKTVCLLAIFAILLAAITIRVFAEGEVSINEIQDKYRGNSVTISGNTTFDSVSIKVLYPNGDQYNIETVQSSGGTYSYTFKLSSDLPYGTYTVVAGRGDITASTTFLVKQMSSEEEITINPIQDKYRGDSVTISGNTTFDLVNIKVLYPNGDQYNVETVQSIGGSYSYTFNLSSSLPYGTYKVVAGRGDKVAVTEFKVIAKNNDATLSSIKINGTLIDGFSPEIKNYTITLPYETTIVPVVTATASDEKATVEITQATSIAPYGTTPGETHKATIVVTAQDGTTKNIYTVTFISAKGTPEDPGDPGDPSDPDGPGVPGDPGGPGQEDTSPIDTKPEDKEPEDQDVDIDAQDINEHINKIIEEIKELPASREIKGKALKDEKDKLFKELENAVYKSLVQEIKAGIEASKATIRIDGETADSIINMMDDIVNAIDELNKKLEENSIAKKIVKKLQILADTDSEISSSNVEIPSSIFNVAGEKGIEMIEITSDLTSFELPAGFIEQSKRGSTISISADRIELDEEQKSKLSESQRQILEQQSTVYDFNVKVDGQSVSKFKGKVTVRIKYELKGGEDKDNITVLYLADDGVVKNMAGKYDEATGEVVFTTDHFSKFIIKNVKIAFSDVKEGFWGKTYIESMASKGIINGRPDGSYDPNGLITRAEFAKLISVAMGIVDDKARCEFSDVLEDKWYYTYVASAVNAGIIKGRPNNVFAPDDNITRQEMAVMIHRALEEMTTKDADILFGFRDWTKVSDWALNALAAVIEVEIINGKPGGIIDPEGYSTRAETAAVIYRFFNY